MQLLALTRSLLCCALLAAPALSQAASYTVVGRPCTTGRLSPNLGGVPLTALNLPKLGTTFTIATEGTTAYQNGNRRTVYVLTGASNKSAGGVPLPFDIALLSPNEPFCGLLQTSGEIVSSVPFVYDPTKSASVSFQIPNVPALAGVPFYQQVVSVETTTFGPPFRAMALSALGLGVLGF